MTTLRRTLGVAHPKFCAALVGTLHGAHQSAAGRASASSHRLRCQAPLRCAASDSVTGETIR